MEAIIFIGIQGSGKTTFYRERFFETHVRISLDLLKTRHREQAFFRTCLQTGQRFVIDNTNIRAAERARYIGPAKSAVPGEYTVEVKAQGFRSERRTGIVIQMNQQARIDFTLEVGNVVETMEVSSTAPLLATENATLAEVVLPPALYSRANRSPAAAWTES